MYRLPLNLDVLNSPGCFINSSPEVRGYGELASEVRLRIPRVKELPGSRVFAQWIIYKPQTGTFLTTRSARIDIGPW